MITTIEELNALPVGSVIQDRHSCAAMKDSDGWWFFGYDSYPAEEVAQDMLPGSLLVSATISREKLSELGGAIEAALNAVAVSLGAADGPGQWDMEARVATEAALAVLGIEVGDD